MRSLLLCLSLLSLGSTTLAQDPDCPFGTGSCPVTLDNVVDVYFHDIVDDLSCQLECQTIPECNYFTMFGVVGSPTDHKKCFLFKSCDTLEECEDCTTGPAYPPIDGCLDGGFSCGTTLDNIVDVFYFDQADDFSCNHQCSLISDCNFWTAYPVNDTPQPYNKCFLFRECNNHEICPDCESGP